MPATESRVRTGRHSATRRGVGARGMLTSDPLQSLQALGAIFSVVVRKARTTEEDAPTYHCTIGRGFTLRKSRVKNGRMPKPNVRNVSYTYDRSQYDCSESDFPSGVDQSHRRAIRVLVEIPFTPLVTNWVALKPRSYSATVDTSADEVMLDGLIPPVSRVSDIPLEARLAPLNKTGR